MSDEKVEEIKKKDAERKRERRSRETSEERAYRLEKQASITKDLVEKDMAAFYDEWGKVLLNHRYMYELMVTPHNFTYNF